MSTNVGESDVNNQLVLISGETGAGKSASLMGLSDPTRVHYYGTEAGKRLPFKSQFQEFRITEPEQVLEGLQYALDNPTEVSKVVIDSATFLMDMYESLRVYGARDTQKAWGEYNQFFKEMMQQHIAKMDIPVIVIAHTKKELNTQTGIYEVSVPIKGALKNNGVEAFFSTIVSAKRMAIRELKVDGYDTDLLHITEEDESLGFKHVFQTRVTAKTIGERIRSPMGLFAPNQTFMDNNAQLLLDHLHRYYS